jgi:hypothetical protein
MVWGRTERFTVGINVCKQKVVVQCDCIVLALLMVYLAKNLIRHICLVWVSVLPLSASYLRYIMFYIK